jgi:methylenetetrahydrofolate--tRNA-(uracil-5-)-methyltransferase
MGALHNYVTTKPPKNFQPMNINFGLFPVKEMNIRNKQVRNQKIFENALIALTGWRNSFKREVDSVA